MPDPRDVYTEVNPDARVITDDEIAEALQKLQDLIGECESATSTAERDELKRRLLDQVFGDELAALAAAGAERVSPRLVRLRHLRGFSRLVKDLETEIGKERQRQATMGHGLDLVTSCAPALQAPAQCKVPFGYVVQPHGVLRVVDQKHMQVCRRPIFPVKRLLGRSGIGLVIAVVAERGVRRAFSVDLAVATDGRRLHEPLSAAGVPITAEEIPQVTRFLAEAYRQNDRVLPEATKVETMGWHGPNGTKGFIAGSTHVTAERITHGDASGSLFLGAMSEGEQELYQSVSSCGDLEGWRAAVCGVTGFPTAALALLSGFAAPLMMPIGVKPFVIDIYGITTSGKTTAARLAASVWGKPTVEVDGYMHTWTTTPTALAVKLSHFSDLVSIVDDTKTIPAKDKGAFQAGVVYTVANGQEKSRATITAGLRGTRSMATILLSTGESSIVSGSKDAGTRARTLSLGDSPFPSAQPAMENGIALHHGVAGPQWVQWLQQQRPQWEAWKARHFELREHLTREATGAVAGRLSDPAALMMLAGELVEQRFDLGLDMRAVFETLVKAMQVGDLDADQPREALDQVFAWALAHREQFWRSNPPKEDVPPQNRGWLGWWPFEETWKELGIRRSELERTLLELGFHPPDVIEQWLARGYLVHDRHKKDTKRPIGKHGERARMIVITRAAIHPDEQQKRLPLA